jgi:two-component system response regulator AtoC
MVVRVLLVVDLPAERRRLERLLRAPGVDAVPLRSRGTFTELLAREDFDLVVFSRERLPRPVRELVATVRNLPEHPEVVVLTSEENPEDRAELLASGCLAVLNRQLADDSLGETLRALVSRRREEALSRLRADRPEERYSLGDFLSLSPSMQRFLEVVRRVAATDTSLLILGETGVGKERLARAVHAEGPRAKETFMALNCGALPESLLESELFGHEEGAFTGASRARKGYFELAHRGTIFLDEIGEMPLHLQVKLLRVLQDRVIHRVGGERPVRVDVRIMAASNRDLEAEMRAGRFRPDLYFRLAVVTLQLPPLRERREDIPKLVESYLEYFRFTLGRPVSAIGADAMRALVTYDWPGNVRELINVMEQACLLAAGPTLTLDDLPGRITGRPRGGTVPPGSVRIPPPGIGDLAGRPLRAARRDVLATFEQAYLAEVLQRTRGRIGEAAHQAGINERSLYDLMRRHRLRKEDFKQK